MKVVSSFVVLVAVLVWSHKGQAETKRSRTAIRNFIASHPCPVPSKPHRVCPGYVVDHIRPLCGGGADKPSNMQWQEYQESLKKDAWERKLCANLHKKHVEPFVL